MSRIHYTVEAMNDYGHWETPLRPYKLIEDAVDDAREIAEDYPRGVRIHKVTVDSELVWTNTP